MANDVYPDVETSPLEQTDPGARTPVTSFTHPSTVGSEDKLYIRIAMSDPTCPSISGTPPTVILRAGSGEEYPEYPVSLAMEDPPLPTDWVPIYENFAETIPFYIGAAVMIPISGPNDEFHDVFQVEILIAMPPGGWEIRIQNDHAAPRYFTWVVADNEEEASQPWLDVSATTMNFDDPAGKTILTGQETEPLFLQIANRGTGPLTITATFESSPSHFEIHTVPDEIPPNSCGDMGFIFNAPVSPGEYPDTCEIEALIEPELFNNRRHNIRVELSASCGKLETVMVLDASGSMAYTPDGTNSYPGIDIAESDTRWGKMKDAAKEFLDLLEDFAGGLGRIGIVLFPDITGPGYPETFPDSTSALLQDSIRIPGDISDIKRRLDWHTPFAGYGWTPMGEGIRTAMGETGSTYGEFEGEETSLTYNRRWMVVMSDGAHNQGPPLSDYYGTGDTSFIGKNIRVIAIAYGDPDAIHWPPEHSQMQDLATNSYGEYRDAGADDEGSGIKKEFRNAIVSELALDPTEDPGGVLTAAEPEIRRHISILPYDTQVSFVVNWATYDDKRVSVQLLTPNCELITPAEAATNQHIKYHGHQRYVIYTVSQDYLRNAADPGRPRYGAWTLIITGHGLNNSDKEPYDYEVITRSRLKMRPKFDKDRYYAGDAITVSARLLLDGKPIPDATVSVHIEAPGKSAQNWIAHKKVSPQEFEQSKVQLKGADVTPLDIKAHAILQKGLMFNSFIRADRIKMTDPSHQGVYSATYAQTQVPGTYKFHIRAVGQTEDGVIFRRERQLHQYIDVRPVLDFSFYHVAYRKIAEDNREYLGIDIRVWPRDRFNNVVLLDPAFQPGIALSVQGGEPMGPLTGNQDGSYSQAFRCDIDSRPLFNLKFKGKEVIAHQKLLPVTCLHYADHVLEFKPGLTAKGESAQHLNPEDALGDVTVKEDDRFVNLQVSGSLTVGVKNQAILSGNQADVVVFVKPDEDLHPYRVEVLPVGSKSEWVDLGMSPGVTRSFDLRKAGVNAAKAIRINDRSSRFSSSRSKSGIGPGVSILGVGFGKVGPISGKAEGCLALPITIARRLLGSNK